MSDVTKAAKALTATVLVGAEIAAFGFAILLVYGLFATNASVLVAPSILLLAIIVVIGGLIIEYFRPPLPLNGGYDD